MISTRNPIDWFNRFTPSQIRPIVSPVVAEMDQQTLEINQLDGLIKEALEKSRYPFIPLENSEIRLHAADALSRLSLYPRCEKELNEALVHAEKSGHAKMALLWALGDNALKLDNESLAFQYWMASRDILQEIIAGRSDIVLKRDMLAWYQSKNAELNLLMAQNCIREIYEWFWVFETSHLSEEAAALGEKIFQVITFQNRQEAGRLIERIERISVINRNYIQTREIMILAATAKYLISEYNAALKNISDAIIQMEPKSKQEAVACWLKGLVELKIPEKEDEGTISLRKSLQLFQGLRIKAEQKNNPLLVQWIDEILVILNKEIKRKQME